MVKSFLAALTTSAAFAYKTNLIIVKKVTESTENEIAGYALDLTYWTEKDAENADNLVLQFKQQVPVSELKAGNII